MATSIIGNIFKTVRDRVAALEIVKRQSEVIKQSLRELEPLLMSREVGQLIPVANGLPYISEGQKSKLAVAFKARQERTEGLKNISNGRNERVCKPGVFSSIKYPSKVSTGEKKAGGLQNKL